MATSEIVVVQDPHMDPDRFILEGIDTSAGPHFTVSQVGKVFFARTPHWVRWLEEQHKNVLDGDPECLHYEADMHEVETLVDDKVEVKQAKTKNSWVVDGVCIKCGGRQVAMTKTSNGSRVYTLTDIELLIHALAGNRAIAGAQAANALSLVRTMAKIHDYLA